MKLIRFGEIGEEKPGVIINENYYSVESFGQDFDEDFFTNNGLNQLGNFIKTNVDKLPIVNKETRLGSPIKKPGKIICIGLNFVDHAKESNAPIPKEPIVFFKATSAICGPNDNLVMPRNSSKTDWEVELALVIGKKASYVEEKDAEDYIAGYILHNDYSERGFQLERGGQWVKGKSCDTFAPLGPFLNTTDTLSDVSNLNMWLKVNGRLMQDSSTSQMIFKVPFLVHYLSQFMTLHPGDIITTGTPKGVGLGFKPPIYLKEGDVVELGIDQLGSSSQKIVAYS